MAKKTFRHKYYKTKGRWSSNITKLENSALQATTGNWSTYTDLCENPAQTNTTVSQQFTVKNVELTFQLESTNTNTSNIESITVYIMYVPQGMTIGNDYHMQHPEYIMAYRFIGSPEFETTVAGIRNPLRVKTRLARRLQTGDKIIAYFEGTNSGTTDIVLNVNGLIRWWTKAN